METSSQIGNGKNVAFIVGSPRSGTTWLLRLLACSPDIRSGSESYLFANYIDPLLKSWQKEAGRRGKSAGGRAQLVGLSTNVTEDEFMGAVRAFAVSLLSSMKPDLGPGQVFIEKTPDHALHLEVIMRTLPDSKVIHIVRDARDVVASILRVQRELGWELSRPNARSAAKLWVNHVRGARSVQGKLTSERFLEVRYETLLSETKETVRKVLAFLGVRWEESDLERTMQALQADNIRTGAGKPIRIRGEASKDLGQEFQMPKEFVGKATAGNWVKDLSWSQKFWVWYVAGETMKEFGYDWNPPAWYSLASLVVRPAVGLGHQI